jgi:hypothetical protein
VIDKCVN